MSTQNEVAAFKALEDFELAERNRVKPVSVMVSSKTGLVSVRQGFEPIAEGQALIADPARPLGTYLFTATNWTDDRKTNLDWTVIGVNEKGLWDTKRSVNAEEKKLPPPTDANKAKAALDRITLPPDILEVIAEVAKPGSSLIISDYDMARSETGRGTDFIVQMPEVIAKYRTPEDIAKAKAKARGMIASTPGNSRMPWYYAPNGIGRVRYTPAPAYRPRPVRYSAPPPNIVYNCPEAQVPPRAVDLRLRQSVLSGLSRGRDRWRRPDRAATRRGAGRPTARTRRSACRRADTSSRRSASSAAPAVTPAACR